MDDVPAHQWVRLDGSMVSIGLTMGVETRAYLDDGEPPILVIETPGAIMTLDAPVGDPATLAVLDELVRAVQAFQHAVLRST